MNVFAISLAIALAMETDLESQLSAYPSREIVDAQRTFAIESFMHLTAMQEIGGKDFNRWITDHVKYLCWSRHSWFLLEDAQNRKRSIKERMEYLSNLKSSLITTGGRMPPVVAYWNFREGPPPPEIRIPKVEKPPTPKAS